VAETQVLRQNLSNTGTTLALFAVDATAWTVGLLAAVWSRYEFELQRPHLVSALQFAVLAIFLQAVSGHLHYLYRGRHWFGSFDEVRAVFWTVFTCTVALIAVDLLAPGRPAPLSTPLVGGALALIFMLAGRYVRRMQRERTSLAGGLERTPVLLFGAGETCHELVGAMLRDPGGKYLPVGLLDDDPSKRHLRLHGVSVLGGRDEVAAAVASTGAIMVIFSVANADSQLIREIRRVTVAAGASFKVVQSVAELLDSCIRVTEVREPRISDLLGRRQIDTDLSSIATYLKDRRVLVTGAGGSIGSELCRQIHQFAPAELMMLDRDESALHAVQLSLRGRALLDNSDLILADLRDKPRIAAIMADHQPQVVFHAAALKHLPMLERHPAEAIKTNIWGTLHLLESAHEVERFVNISSDKAANPVSVLGYSKRITERLTAYTAHERDGTFLSVRFGNVLGSRGSVLTTFAAQITAGGPLTVTHPDITRYFMTIDEAVQLVIQAAAIGRPGEALVLDMGKSVRIADMARQMAAQASSPIEIIYTGIRPGEKMHEELLGTDERDSRPLHPLISHVEVAPLDPEEAHALDALGDRNKIVAELARLCQLDERVASVA
jgi:FlaA1/EpsC-like NDP-sugar epimerase